VQKSVRLMTLLIFSAAQSILSISPIPVGDLEETLISKLKKLY